MNWYLRVLKKYAVFTGRARRKEFWMWLLFNSLPLFVLVFVPALILPHIQLELAKQRMAGTPESDLSLLVLIDHISYVAVIIYLIYTLGVAIPGLAVTVRRLHDTNRSGWWALLGIVPLIGLIVLLVFMGQDGKPGDNQYGPNPKAGAA